jgi:NADPH2:quinone reductase
MHAAVLHKFGEAPRLEEYVEPVPGPGEVRVRVEAAAVKALDRGLATGKHYASPRTLPVVVGTDGVGRLDDGRRVFIVRTRAPFGTMAEWTVAPAAACWPLPEGIDPLQAAAALNPGLSAWLGLEFRAGLVKGEAVVILGATGTAGRLAVRIAKLLGAQQVVAVARDEAALEELRSQGADAVISLRHAEEEVVEELARELQARNVTVAIDYLAGAPAELLFRALARSQPPTPEGTWVRYVQIGESAGSTLTVPPSLLRSHFVELTGIGLGTLPPPEVVARSAASLFGHLVRGELSVPLLRFPLAEVATAWARSGSPRPVVVP